MSSLLQLISLEHLGEDTKDLFAYIHFKSLCVFSSLVDSTPEWSAPVAVVLAFCLISLHIWLATGIENRKMGTSHFLTLEALCSIIVPAIYAHPKQYGQLFKQSVADKVIGVDFEEFWAHITYGRIELKDDMTLEELCLDKVYVFGQRISFNFNWVWKMLALKSLFHSYLVFLWERLSHHEESSKKKVVDIPNLGSCLVNDTLDLDFIPLPFIGTALFLAKIQLAPNETFDVEFTSLASTTFMSFQYWLCAALLLPNRHNISTSKRTALPFFVSLPAIVNRFSFSSVVIQSVEDISEAHAGALEAHERDMILDKWMRSSFVARHGLEAWRETGMRLKWEAALLKAKILVRWKITMYNAKQT